MDPTRLERAITQDQSDPRRPETFGNPSTWTRYRAIAAPGKVAIEGLLGPRQLKHKGQPCGSFGRVRGVRLLPNKQITTGEGGMIVTDDELLAEMCRKVASQPGSAAQLESGSAGSGTSALRLRRG